MAGRTTLRLALLAIVLNSRLFVAAGTAGDDFTNNLFTDLAPLLGLFGEKFAQQFLAESFTFWDHILFAMAPLGILTAIVGAIRVDGANWLKRLVGRARENTADAEIELMSSVSQEVCEVWNGTSIVRSMGSPQVKQIIHLPAKDGDFSPESFITMDRKTWSSGYELKARYWSAKDTGSEKLSTTEDNNGNIEKGPYEHTVHPLEDEELIKIKEIPPNISLNIHGGSNPVELVVYALIASTLQAAALGWSSYALKYGLSGSKPSVGFPLQAAGTVLLTLGLVLCAGIIDNGSRERHWLIEGELQVGTMSKLLSSAKSKFKALANKLWLAKDTSLREKKHRHMQLYWVQKQHIAGDNSFDPYILYAEELNDKVHESHRAKENDQNDRDDQVHESPRAKENGQNDRDDTFLRKLFRLFGRHLTTFAVVIGVLGYFAQFQGLRFSNWTCSIAQLIALGFATILRAWVRRTMTKTPVATPVDNNDHILDQLTLAIVGRGRSGPEFPHPKAFLSPELSLRFAVTTYPKFRAIPESKSKDQVQPRSGNPNQAYSEPADPGSQPSINLQDSKEATESKPEDEIQPSSEHLDQGSSEPANSVTRHSINVQDSREAEKKPNLAQQALDLRVRLGRITKWTGPKLQEAILLSNSIETALGTLSPKLPAEFGKKCAVVLQVDTYRNMQHIPPIATPESTPEEVELYITKDRGKWKVDDSQLEALLSLVSYTVWTAEQIKRNQDSSRHTTKESSVKDSRSIGWLRAKAPDSRIYDIIVGKSSPRLVSDLHWWVSDTDQYLKKAKIVHTCRVTRVLANFAGPLSDAEASCDKVERPALGFYVNDENPGENDIFCSWECKERQVTIFHLFSTFIWAAAPHLSASRFHPTAVTSTYQLPQWARPDFAQLKSDKIEMLVQELQSTGLGTSEEIYKMLIPPLSHFRKLPNEAMADFWNETMIKEEGSWRYGNVFGGYYELLHLVQHREAQDRFANRVAAMLVEFRLRVAESPEDLPQPDTEEALVYFNKHLGEYVKNNVILKAILSLNNVLARRWGLPINGNPGYVLAKLGFVDLLVQPQRENILKEDLRTSDYTLSKNDFSFPNNRDVFGWTIDYWSIFENLDPVPADEFGGCIALDIAGRSVLHNKIDSNRGTRYSERYSAHFVYGGDPAHVSSSSIFIARCNKQTPLHRAARLGRRDITSELLWKGGPDPNAADHFGRTALSLAAYHGDSDLVGMLYDRMEPDDRARTDRNGRNALHYAVWNQKQEAVLKLIDVGIDINAEDYLGRPPLWYAAWNDMTVVVEWLLRRDEIQIPILREYNPDVPNYYITSQEKACEAKIEKWAERIKAGEDMESGTSEDTDLSQDHGDPLAAILAGSDVDSETSSHFQPSTKSEISPLRDESRTTATTYPDPSHRGNQLCPPEDFSSEARKMEAALNADLLKAFPHR